MAKRILYTGLDPSHYQTADELIHCPFIQIVPRPLTDSSLYQALQAFSTFTHVVITSKSSVPILHDYLTQLGFPMEVWRSKVTCAVGQVTAFHLRQLHIFPQVIAQEETAEGLVKALDPIDLQNSHVFWPHSSEARPVIKNFLERKNILHQSCVLYDPLVNWRIKLPNLDQLDEIVFTSPSTVKAFLAHFHQFPTHLKLTAVGPITARFLAAHRQKVEE